MADYFYKVGRPGSATTMAAPGYTTGATTITVGSTANWPTDTKVAFAIDRAEIVAGEEVQIAGTYTEWTGQVTGATTIGSMALSSDSPNSDQNYAAGSLTRVYIPVSATRENNLIDGILEHANQDGTLITQAVRDALSLGVGSGTGWEVGSLPDVSTVTANGNRSYNVTFASDVSATLSEGMRLRTTRTVASTQNAFSLDGTNDYYNKTSPSGMTFTDDFVVSAWVYVTAYQIGYIASRYNGTSGWGLTLNADGTIHMRGWNASSGNYSEVKSYQSVPLNRWVHIAAQLDMSAFTATTTTSYVMIDGVNVPSVVARAGTNPTALIQAGNLEIGSINSGTNPFPGKIDQVAIYSAKVTQATHLAAMHQGLTGSETSLISAYANGSTTDLNTTNANNLTAQNGATTVASAPWGNRGTSTTLDYGLVMSVSGSTVTVQVPEGCTIPTTGGVTSVAYSTQANPYGWPGISSTLSRVGTGASQGSIGASAVILGGLTTTVVIPVSANKTKIEVFVPFLSSTVAAHATLSIYNAATVTGTAIQTGLTLIATAGTKTTAYLSYEFDATPGTQNYCAAVAVDSGTGSTTLSGTQQATLTVSNR